MGLMSNYPPGVTGSESFFFVEDEPERKRECRECICYATTEHEREAMCFNCQAGFHGPFDLDDSDR